MSFDKELLKKQLQNGYIGFIEGVSYIEATKLKRKKKISKQSKEVIIKILVTGLILCIFVVIIILNIYINY
jgi:hypothetical protein